MAYKSLIEPLTAPFKESLIAKFLNPVRPREEVLQKQMALRQSVSSELGLGEVSGCGEGWEFWEYLDPE